MDRWRRTVDPVDLLGEEAVPLTITFGGQPLEVLADKIERANVDVTDLRYALERQRSRILERTRRGVDLNGSTFAPYSTKGPYYYYPSRLGSAKSRSAAAARLGRKIGGTRTRLGIKFASYAAFKASLGRNVVDLTGPRAPHMLQAMVVRTKSGSEGTIGIYGSEADRAEGHNVGVPGRLPRREFFGWSASDEKDMVDDLEKIVAAKMEKIL